MAIKERCDVEKGPRAEGHACNSSSLSRVNETATAIAAHNVGRIVVIDNSGFKEGMRKTVGQCEVEWVRRRDGGMVGSGGFIRSLSSNDLRRSNITLEVALNKNQFVDTGIGPIIPSPPYKDMGIGPSLVGRTDNQPSKPSFGLQNVARKQPIALTNISHNQEAQMKQKIELGSQRMRDQSFPTDLQRSKKKSTFRRKKEKRRAIFRGGFQRGALFRGAVVALSFTFVK
ncbi:hypothetical protein LOK49_LG06G00650 [Camellia lanceoleosa]|uniref:Uncharacterized protein n=1 Tax=Camellia lanceoleosa TaxID=1840588 RepID=A0ACC0H9D1_9ERIC|nr:hypothetical protein LOK49_LG06G00650 [Camellia lanceoleosa]